MARSQPVSRSGREQFDPPKTPTEQARAIAELDDYLSSNHPRSKDELELPEHPARRAVRLLRRISEKERANEEATRRDLETHRGHEVARAVARLLDGSFARGRLDRLSVEEIREQTRTLVFDDEFWGMLRVIDFDKQRMRRLLGPWY